MAEPPSRRLCVAPMLDCTDRHCRYFHRLIAPRALLYTEMVTTGALLFGRDPERFLAFDPAERPLALQLGGSDPAQLARAASMAEAMGYDEVNLNCGCPSDRVQRGRFGACLMREPALVAECVAAMRAATALPVTVKCRIGVDDSEDFAFLLEFVDGVAAAGCGVFIVHARKAWLKGLSPKQNRELPPLRYPLVHQLKRARPALTIVVNGGLRDPAAAARQLDQVDGVMIGREAYENPWSLRRFEAVILDGLAPADFAPADLAPASLAEAGPVQVDPAPADRAAVVARMSDYAQAQQHRGVPVRKVTRHMLGLFNGLPGARAWRRRLGELGGAAADDAAQTLLSALAMLGPSAGAAA